MHITLTRPLNYTHLGITVTLPDGTVFEARAEVGILTRNILIRGSDNVEWNDKIPSCPDGFDTGILSFRHQMAIMLIFKACWFILKCSILFSTLKHTMQTLSMEIWRDWWLEVICNIMMEMTVTDTKLEEMGVLGIHWWSPFLVLWFLIICFYSQGPLLWGLEDYRVICHPEATSVGFSKKM